MLKELVRTLLPARVKHRLKRAAFPILGRAIEWEYLPGGFQPTTGHPAARGWNVAAVVHAYQSAFAEYERRVQGVDPLGFWYEGGVSSANDLIVPHNIHMSYAYAFATASRGRSQVRMLDWGGALGQYYALTRALFPDMSLEYLCKETPELVRAIGAARPGLHFTADAGCLDRTFDFVMASGSLHYEEDWRALLTRLAAATTGHLYVTRLPTVLTVPSFAFIQRPYSAGYNTEYVGWCINRDELLRHGRDCGLDLVREFVLGENPEIDFAPEANQYRGFLWRPAASTSAARPTPGSPAI